MADAFWRRQGGDVLVQVKARPGAKRESIGKVRASAAGMALEVATTQAAERGRANAAICALLARALGVPQSAVTVERGATGRLKVLRITAADDDVVRRLEQWMRGEEA